MSDRLTDADLDDIEARLTRASEGDPRAFLACAHADVSDLLAEIRRLRAEAWDEGYQACRTRPRVDGYLINRVNPYRKTGDDHE